MKKFNFTKKHVAVTAFASLSFGLMAGCAEDTNSPTLPSSGTITPTEEVTNPCIYDGYSAVPGTNGETICMDAEGNLIFWINSDGSYGFPEAADTTSNENGGGTNITLPIPVSSSSNPIIVASSSSVEVIEGVSSSVVEGISSSTIFPESSSSSSQEPSTISSSSYETVSNGNTPAITYAASGATVQNDNGCISINGGEVVISCAGEYDFSGSYSGSDGQIRVYSPKADTGVYLNLRGLTLNNTSDAPIYVQMASKVFVVAKSGTTNTLSDGNTRTKSYTYLNSNGNEKVDTTGAAIYSKDDLTIKGTGTLTVKGNYNNGIQSSNDLRFRGETVVNVTAANNGIKGKGSVDIEKGILTIAATSGDAIKSDECTINGTDTTITEGKGIVSIKGGTINITKAGDDGIQAFNYVMISDSVTTPSINVTSTGKGIVSDNRVYINGGQNTITSGDDGVHSNSNIDFNGGYTTITAKGNDGVHADSTLRIAGGTIYVKDSYEGLEAWYITITGGITDVYGSDDGWNAAGGNDGSGNTTPGGGWNWGRGGMGGGMGGMSSTTGHLTVTGGVHYVKTGSGDTDGIDSNGDLTISGGVVVVECQISGGMGGSFDSDGTATLTSKTLLGFSKSKSEAGTSYNVNFSTTSYYGNSNIAFKPTTSGSYIQATSQPSNLGDSVSGYANSVTFPNGSTVYYN